jgi:hypothetical protein
MHHLPDEWRNDRWRELAPFDYLVGLEMEELVASLSAVRWTEIDAI